MVRNPWRQLERTRRKAGYGLLYIGNAGVESPRRLPGSTNEQILIVIARQTVLDSLGNGEVRRGHARGRGSACGAYVGNSRPPNQRRGQAGVRLLVGGWVYLVDTWPLCRSSIGRLSLIGRGIVGPRRTIGFNDAF